ncbi:MAG: hypothetical protein IJ045_04220 [Ruminiclostridium sp.]|nr:hypothetical protein [Ruminiclostridium sp.]
MAENYLSDWSDISIWQHDGTLGYDEENKVLFFDSKKERNEEEKGRFSDEVVINIDNCDGWCRTELDIPDGMDSFRLIFKAANGAVTGGDRGCVSAEFLNQEGEIVGTVATTPIADKKYFYEYMTKGQKEDEFATIPEDAEKMQLCIYGKRDGTSLDFYVKDITLEFAEKPYADTPIAGINAVYVNHKVNEKPVIIGQDVTFGNAFLWIGLGILVVATATVIFLYEKGKRKIEENDKENQ